MRSMRQPRSVQKPVIRFASICRLKLFVRPKSSPPRPRKLRLSCCYHYHAAKAITGMQKTGGCACADERISYASLVDGIEVSVCAEGLTLSRGAPGYRHGRWGIATA